MLLILIRGPAYIPLRIDAIRGEDADMRICLYTDTALPKMGGQEIVVDALSAGTR